MENFFNGFAEDDGTYKIYLPIAPKPAGQYTPANTRVATAPAPAAAAPSAPAAAVAPAAAPAAAPAPTAATANNQRGYLSNDGRVRYSRPNNRGYRLDSLGHPAFSSGGGGGGAPAPPAGLAPGAPIAPGAGELGPQLSPGFMFNTAPWMQNAFGGPMGPAAQFPGAGAAPVPWPNLDDASAQRAMAYYNAALPWYTFAQNAYQYDRDFGEASRRFDQQFDETQVNNLFNRRATAYSAGGNAFLGNPRYLTGGNLSG